MTTQQEHVFPYYRSPSDIRNEAFTHRMRGLDEAEVREYLDLLADQVQTAENEHAEFRAENARLRAENTRLRAANERLLTEQTQAGGAADGNSHAVALFSEAQAVADALVEEAVQRARELMTEARAKEREILRQAHEAADAAAREASRTDAGRVEIVPLTPVAEVEYVRAFAKVTQVQLRNVLEAVAEQVNRLGELSTGSGDVNPMISRGGAPISARSSWQVGTAEHWSTDL